MLRRAVVEVGKRHGGFEERIPPDGIAHRPGQIHGVFAAQTPLQGSDNAVEFGHHPVMIVGHDAQALAPVVHRRERDGGEVQDRSEPPADGRG